MVHEPFFGRSDAQDETYRWLRDNEYLSSLRDRIEALWIRYSRICPDDDTIGNAARDACHAMTWQMYLSCVLEDHGLLVQSATSHGPDIPLEHSNKRHWVEAVVALPGGGVDAARPANEQFKGIQVSYGMDQNAVILRYRNSIEEKHRKLACYLQSGVVSSDEPFVIAINGGALLFPESDNRLPNIVRAVLPIGKQTYLVPLDGTGRATTQYPYSPSVQKQSGRAVATTVFLDPAYNGISGVFFSPAAIWNAPEQAGTELIFVHNPNASNAIPLGTFRFGREYWLDVHRSEMNWEHWKDGKRSSSRP